MSVNQWARWVELNNCKSCFEHPLDIRQVPELVDALRKKFFQGKKELSLYEGLFNIACDYLPAPSMGMGYGERKEPIAPNTYKDLFRERVENIPLKDGDVEMSAQAFRLALIGSQAFKNSCLSYKRIFYGLGLKEKKYILAKQPDLFPFRTQLPAVIGDSSLQQILAQSTPQDFFHDAALFGGDTLLKAIEILKEMVPEFVSQEPKTYEEILVYYPAKDRRLLGYNLMMHQITLHNGRILEIEETDALLHSLNSYCSQPGADMGLLSLVYPKHPFKRALLIAEWCKNCPFRVHKLHIPCAEITKILLAKQLALRPQDFDPDALMREFDVLDFWEKKRFISQIILEKKIEVYWEKNKKEFLEAVQNRRGQPFNSSFKLALMARRLTFVDKPSQICLPALEHEQMIREVDTYLQEDMTWFIDHFFKDKEVLKLFLQDQSITSFFNILNKLKTSLGSAFNQELLPFLEKKILEICPANIAPYALSQLSRELRLGSSLKKYLEEKLKKQGFDQCAVEMCTKFFSHQENGIRFLFSIALLPTPSGEYLLYKPEFVQCVPEKYRADVELLSAFLEPFDGEGRDFLEDKLQTLPLWLKQLLMEDIKFATHFEEKVLSRLNQLYEKGCIPSKEMFYFATRLPYSTFLKLAQECRYDASVSGEIVQFKGRKQSITEHIREISLSMRRDIYAAEDLRQFLNRCPQTLIGEGRWLHYLALEAPKIFDLHTSKIISQFLPMELIPYLLEFLKPEHRANYLNPRLESIYSKNIDKFSPKVQDWLIEHLTDWLPLQQDLLRTLHEVWEMPRKGLEAKLSDLEQTQNLLNIFQQQTSSLEGIAQKLKGTNSFQKVDDILQECKKTEDKLSVLRQRMTQIDLAPISDIITEELLEGEVYSLEGKGWILKNTRDQMKKSPYTREGFEIDEEKDQKIPLISPEEREKLVQSKREIDQKIEALRIFLLHESKSQKRPCCAD